MAVLRVQLAGVDDPRLEGYRSVRDSELLRRRGFFVAEGRIVVERLLDAVERGYRVASLLLNDASFASLEHRLSQLPEVPVYVCSTHKLASIVGFNFHRGCLALAERPPDCDPSAIANGTEVVLVLEGVADADNVGSAFRNAAAFGAGAVLLSPACCDPLYRKAIRTSMGSVLRVPYARLSNWPHDLAALKNQGFTLVALTPGGHATELAAVPRRRPRQKIALLVGSEGRGLTAEAEALADVCMRIPMQPAVDSLNLATATGIALYHLTV
jgi:tRNA G18 (ribose-2'-O)-methylase SpoU